MKFNIALAIVTVKSVLTCILFNVWFFATLNAEISDFTHAEWQTMGGMLPGTNGTVTSIVVDESGQVYVGGDFSVVGDLFAHGLAMWDGNAWSTVGGEAPGGPISVYALALMGTELYVAGEFERSVGERIERLSGIAKWDGQQWTSIGRISQWRILWAPFGSARKRITALAVLGNDLYVGGSFSTVGEVEAENIAKWDGRQWSALGQGVGDRVLTMAVAGGDLYVGGEFLMAGENDSASYIARWDGEAWSPLGSGVSQVDHRPKFYVSKLVASESHLYVSGTFDRAGGKVARGIAKWDGMEWSPLGTGFDVADLAVSDDEVFALGRSHDAEWNDPYSVVKWDEEAWTPIGSPFSWRDNITLSGGGGALFATIPGGNLSRIVTWDGQAWRYLGNVQMSVDDRVLALRSANNRLYVGGSFTSAGGITAHSVASWDGNQWAALGSGLQDGFLSGAYTFVELNGDLYVGGDFESAGDIRASNIAKWDGQRWSALGEGLGSGGGPLNCDAVFDLAVLDGEIYASGVLMVKGAVVRWTGAEWTALPGLNGEAVALKAIDDRLFAAGHLTDAEGPYLQRIFQWDGNQWSSLSSGLNGSIQSLETISSDLYVGGDFTEVDGEDAHGIAKWDGVSWSAVGSGLSGKISALLGHGSDLYAAGSFSEWNGKPHDPAVPTVGKWDGATWSLHFQGVCGGSINSMAVLGNDLYVGGTFAFAGNKPSAHIARLPLDAPPPGIFGIVVDGEVSIDFRANADAYHVLESSNNMLPGTWEPVENTSVERIGDKFRFTSARLAVDQNYYRLSLLPEAP